MTHTQKIQNIPAQTSSKASLGEQSMKGKKILVAGKAFTYSRYCVKFETLSDAGWILITSIGSENLYFLFKSDSGEVLPGYCKCL